MNGYIEVNPLPERCIDCKEDCYNCDYTLDRFQRTKEQEIKNIIRCKITHIKLLQRQLHIAKEENKKGKKDKYIKLLQIQIKDLKEDIVKLERERDRI